VYVGLAGQYYLLLGAAEYAKPITRELPGARATVGFDWKAGRGFMGLGLELGFNVAEVAEVAGRVEPLTVVGLTFSLKIDYAAPLWSHVAIRPGVVAGIQAAISGEGLGMAAVLGPRLHMEWRFGSTGLSLSFGGGTDLIPEAGGLIVLPAVEAGLRIRPRMKL
jgi:hypothetical protein